MAKGWTWVRGAAKKAGFKVPVRIKEQIEKQAGRLIESELRLRHVKSKPPAKTVPFTKGTGFNMSPRYPVPFYKGVFLHSR